MDEDLASALPHAVARQILLGRRESLTIAGELGVPVAAVNEALLRLRSQCRGCISLHQPYAGEPRFIFDYRHPGYEDEQRPRGRASTTSRPILCWVAGVGGIPTTKISLLAASLTSESARSRP